MDPSSTQAMRANARLGLVLRDKWRIDRLLGSGGMATVYAATHCNNGKRVAIKILHSELSGIPEVRTRFLREGYVANKVAHPGIVSVLDDDIADDGSVFLVMELLEGETVESLRERSGNYLPARQLVKIADQLLDVLAAAHQAGIVHRDIKPENLFMTQASTLKVLDFGIARLRELSSAQLTMTGAGAMGTPAFMPPEQARGRSEQVGPRTDIWAVGATMFTLASGRLVHEAETVNELLLAAMTRPSPPLLSVLPAFPPAIAAVIDRALAFDQAARYADARTMQIALRQAASTIGIVLEDWSSISGINPIVSLGLMSGLARDSGPPAQANSWPGAGRGPSANPPPPPNAAGPMPPRGPMYMQPPQPPPRASVPEFFVQPPPRASVPEFFVQPQPRASVPEFFVQSPPRASVPEFSIPYGAQGPTGLQHGAAMIATAPAVTVGPGRGTSSPAKGLLLAIAALIVVLLGGVGVWAGLRSRPAAPPAVITSVPLTVESAAPRVEPVEPVEPVASMEPAPMLSPTTSATTSDTTSPEAPPMTSGTAFVKKGGPFPRPPASAGPKKTILDRRH